jgi:hypothetical protein
MYKDGDVAGIGRLAYAADDKAYLIGRKGLVEYPKDKLTLVDTSKTYEKGDKVRALLFGPFSSTVGPAKIHEVVAEDVLYKVKTDEGKVYTVSYAYVLPPE